MKSPFSAAGLRLAGWIACKVEWRQSRPRPDVADASVLSTGTGHRKLGYDLQLNCFLLGFLPAVYGVFILLVRARASVTFLLVFVALASLVFYAWAGLGYLLIFVCSISVNYALAGALERVEGLLRRLLLAVGIAFNLGLLGYFKYKNFFLDSLGIASTAAVVRTVLPVGISFYTFQKIAYLVDIARGLVKPKPFLHYLFFVTFFPQLVAGPIVRHDDIFPKLPRFGDNVRRDDYATVFMVPAICLIVVGLVKKTIFADGFAMLADRRSNWLPAIL